MQGQAFCAQDTGRTKLENYKQPLVLGINQDTPSAHMSLPERLSFYGQNTGNLLFAESLYQVVDNARPGSYHFKPAEIENADVVIVAAANWINAHSDFGSFAARLRSFGKPVVLVGIGIQVEGSESPEITVGTRNLLDLAAETSNLISVRGYETKKVLKDWGYNNVVATGCPSLLLSNGQFACHALTPAATSENTVMMGTRHLLNQTSPEQEEIYRLAYHNGVDILMQSELADMYFIENMPREHDVVAKANKVLTRTYGDSNINNIRNYLYRQGKVFFHARDWRKYLQGKEYVVGTRIHGTIATILSGRRGILLTHDQRTVELADIMGIPSCPISEFSPASLARVSEMIAHTDFSVTCRQFLQYYTRFKEFFQSNGVLLRSPPRRFGE